jgi:TRAP transporter TAXI family solute receptor
MRLLGVIALLALAGCLSGGPITPSGRIVIAAGARGGVYYAYARALADELRARDPRLRVEVVATTGSVDNLQRVARGQATIAFTAADAAAGSNLPIAALARVYDDYLHLVVLASNPRHSIGQLAGAAVSVGPQGSGTRLMVDRLLAIADAHASRINIAQLGLDDSVEALRRHRIDAFFWSGGLPTPGVERLARAVPLRLLPLGGLSGGLQARFGGVYRAAAIPEDMYGVPRQVSTIAVPNLIVCRDDADGVLMRLVVSTLFERRAAIADGVSAAVALDGRAAIETAPVPLHPAALRWYRDTKT